MAGWGQILGLLGNSGYSDAPHLHFQVTDEVKWYKGQGFPYVFKEFIHHGRLTEEDAAKAFSGIPWQASADPRIDRNRLPSQLAVIAFP